MIKKLLLSLCAIAFMANYANAQVVSMTESFDNTTFVPTGWILKTAIGSANGQPLWVRSTASTFPTVNPHSGLGMARFRSRSGAAGAKQQLSTPALDYSNRGTTATNVSFWMYRDDQNINYDSITVYVNNTDSVDGNAMKIGTVARNRTFMMPDTQAVNGWYEYSFAVPASFTGNMTTHIIFEGNCENILGNNQGANTTIDDVSYDVFPAPCTGVPNVGNVMVSTPVICGGSGTVTFSVSSPITTTGVTYTWQVSNAAAGPWTNFGTNSSTVTSGTLTVKTFVRCTVNCLNSGLNYTTNYDSVKVSTSPLPVVSTTPSTAAYCNGSAIGALLVASGASTYTWSPSTGLNATTGNVVSAMPTGPTQYTVIGTDSNGCIGSATVNVTLANVPIISFTTNPATTSVCKGSTIIVNPIQGGGNTNTYAWSNGITTRRDTVVVNADMYLTVTVTNQAGCSSTDSIMLTALPAQNSGFSYTQSGNTFAFMDTTTASTLWSWDFGDGNTSMNQNPTYTFSTAGTYNVTFIVKGSCKTDTITKTIVVYPLGTNDVVSNTSIAIYPNPTNDNLTITSTINSIENIKILNLFGQKVKEIKLNNNTKSTTISVKDLPNGMYSIQLNAGNKISSLKFSKF